MNPAAAVRGPKHVVTKGATPAVSPAEARRLLEVIDTAALAGRRDRALVSVMLYSFARVSAVIGMRRQDCVGQRHLAGLVDEEHVDALDSYGDIRRTLLAIPAVPDADRSLPVPASPRDWLAERQFALADGLRRLAAKARAGACFAAGGTQDDAFGLLCRRHWP